MILWYVAAQANVSYMFNTLSIDNTNIFFIYIYKLYGLWVSQKYSMIVMVCCGKSNYLKFRQDGTIIVNIKLVYTEASLRMSADRSGPIRFHANWMI